MANKTVHTPKTEAEAADIVRQTHANGGSLRIMGGGSKQSIGQPVQASAAISTAGLRGIEQYNPAELVFVARAGTSLKDITAELDKNGQALAFEPASLSGLLGNKADQTIGGIASTNLSGPRRFVSGAARDSLLGVRFVNGTGEIIKNGGRVMKNVTGLDLVKLMAGSWGTLGLMTEVSFKVLPKAETALTLAVHGTDASAAATIMAQAMATSTEVSGAGWLPESIAKGCKLDTRTGVTLLRLEGFKASVKDRRERLLAALGSGHEIADVTGKASQTLWASIRDVKPFADKSLKPVWRISVAPMAGARIVEAAAKLGSADAFMDWQGGQVWLRCGDEADAQASAVRGAVAAAGGGHATLIRAREDIRAITPVFQPEVPALAALTARVRASVDPSGVFNPGLMVLDTARSAA